MADASVPNAAETVAWEQGQSRRAGLLTLVAGNLILYGGLATMAQLNDVPNTSTLDGIRDAAGLPLTVGKGLQTEQVLYYDDHSIGLVIAAIVSGIGLMAVAAALGFLFRATRARVPTLPKLALYGALLGPALVGVGTIVLDVARAVNASDFAGGSDMGTQAAHDALGGGAVVASQVMRQAGGLLVAFSFVLITLNATRAGLLSKRFGYTGMACGFLLVFPLESLILQLQFPLIECLWLIALGFLYLDRWPQGRPPAWAAGEAIPWPSQQDLREAAEGGRVADIDEKPRRSSDEDDEIIDASVGSPVRRPGAASQSASKKRKRKRR